MRNKRIDCIKKEYIYLYLPLSYILISMVSPASLHYMLLRIVWIVRQPGAEHHGGYQCE